MRATSIFVIPGSGLRPVPESALFPETKTDSGSPLRGFRNDDELFVVSGLLQNERST